MLFTVGIKAEKLGVEQIRRKVPIIGLIHMKRSLTTRLYSLGQNAKFDNCSPRSQKVINHLVKCFSYAIAQNKGDSKGIQAALRCIVPHAFGDHCLCGYLVWVQI